MWFYTVRRGQSERDLLCVLVSNNVRVIESLQKEDFLMDLGYIVYWLRTSGSPYPNNKVRAKCHNLVWGFDQRRETLCEMLLTSKFNDTSAYSVSNQ